MNHNRPSCPHCSTVVRICIAWVRRCFGIVQRQYTDPYLCRGAGRAPGGGSPLTVLDESGTALAHLTADADGRAEAADLPAPDAAYSLDAANTAVRYALYRLEAALDGWQPRCWTVCRSLTAADGSTAGSLTARYSPRRCTQPAAKRRVIAIPPTRCFPGTAAAALRRRRFSPGDVLSRVVIPKKSPCIWASPQRTPAM